MALTTADTVIAVVILFLALKGVLVGFAKEFFSTAGIVGGIFAASHFADDTAEMMKSHLFNTAAHTTLKFAAFIIILAVVWWSVSSIGKLIDSRRGDSGLSTASKAGGYITALFKYFVVVSLILFVIMQTPSLQKKSIGRSISSSKIYPLMAKSASWLLNANTPRIK